MGVVLQEVVPFKNSPSLRSSFFFLGLKVHVCSRHIVPLEQRPVFANRVNLKKCEQECPIIVSEGYQPFLDSLKTMPP